MRTILRDREILTTRLIKLSNKKTGSNPADVDAHQGKLEDAKRELAACEAALKSEQWALGGVKRRIFRDALGMRMRSLGDLASVLATSSRSAVELLDSLGADPAELGSYLEFRQGSLASPMGSRAGSIIHADGSIAPSQSASQVALRQAGMAGAYPSSVVSSDDGNSVNEYNTVRRQLQNGPSSPKRAVNVPAPVNEEEVSSDEDARGRQLQAHKGGATQRQSFFGRQASVGTQSVASEPAARKPVAASVADSDDTARPEERRHQRSSSTNSGFWSSLTGLFRSKPSRREGSWDTARTDRYLQAVERRKRDSSDDEGPDQRNLVRVKNKRPGILSNASEQNIRRQAELAVAGNFDTPAPASEPRRRTMSDVGVGGAGATGMSRSGTITSTVSQSTAGPKRRKKRAPAAINARAPSIMSIVSDPSNDTLPVQPGSPGLAPSRTYLNSTPAKPTRAGTVKKPAAAKAPASSTSSPNVNGLLPISHMVLPSANPPPQPAEANGALSASHMVLPSAPPRLALAEIRASSSAPLLAPQPIRAPQPVRPTPVASLAPPNSNSNAKVSPSRSASPLPSAIRRAESPANDLNRRKSVRIADGSEGGEPTAAPALANASPEKLKSAPGAVVEAPASSWRRARSTADDSSDDDEGADDQAAYIKVC